MIRLKTDLGYTRNMKEITRGKVLKTLNKLIRYENKVMNRIEFIASILVKGYEPKVIKNYRTYSQKLKDYTKARTQCVMSKDSSIHEITKTEYDFAIWMIENNLVTENNIKDYEIKEENIVLSKLAKEKEELEKIEQERHEKMQDNIKFEKWLEEQAKEYLDKKDARIDAMTTIYNDNGLSMSINFIKIIVCIDNIDNIKCKSKLKEVLHTGNQTSKKVFYYMSGIKLPNTNKGTYDLINGLKKDDIKSCVPYKKKNIKNDKDFKDTQEFYIKKGTGVYEKVDGILFKNKYNMNLFINKAPLGNYCISHIDTGLTIGCTQSTIEGCIKEFYKNVKDDDVKKYFDMFEKAIKNHGTVPSLEMA